MRGVDFFFADKSRAVVSVPEPMPKVYSVSIYDDSKTINEMLDEPDRVFDLCWLPSPIGHVPIYLEQHLGWSPGPDLWQTCVGVSKSLKYKDWSYRNFLRTRRQFAT